MRNTLNIVHRLKAKHTNKHKVPAVGSLAKALSKALVMDWKRFIFWVCPV